MDRINVRQWRIINMALIVMGLFMPWVMFFFDMQVVSEGQSPPSGWEFFLSTWRGVISDIQIYGFELLMLPFWLVSISGMLLLLYLALNVLYVIENKNYKDNKALPIILAGVIAVFLSLIFMGGTPYTGYWLSNLGLLSSIILEWKR